MEKINIYNYKIIDEGATLLHYQKDNVKLCNSVKHNIKQLPPQPQSELDYCTACAFIIEYNFK